MSSDLIGVREYRVGHGSDVHALVEGRSLILGGVTIPHTKGLLGHSDGDALLHAIIDGLLGATGRTDIGTIFPNTAPEWKGANSISLLKKVWEEISRERWKLNNLDCTILAQAPPINPYIRQMKENLSSVLGTDPSRCGIKATSTEGLGFIGREEGIMASCVVMLERKKTT